MIGLLSALMGFFAAMAAGSSSDEKRTPDNGRDDKSTPDKGRDDTDTTTDDVRPPTVVKPIENPEPEPVVEAVTEATPEPDPEPVVMEDPEPEPEPEAIADSAPPPALSADNEIILSDASGTSQSVMTGRVHKFELESDDEIAEIEITDLPEYGNVSVNPDNSIVVVLSGETATGLMSFSYDVTFADGSVESYTTDLDVTEGAQEKGWGQGEFYMLETDENDDVIVEAGDVHRPVYVSGSDEAITKADIAALEGLEESQITTNWLIDNPEYGGSEGMALSSEVGLEVWTAITDAKIGPTSHWLLFERGYEYDDSDRLVGRGVEGEDELHPVHITSWGDGDLPILTDRQNIYQEPSANVVFTDIQFSGGVRISGSENILFDDVKITGEEAIFRGTDGITIRNSEISDVFREESRDGDGVWESHEDRVSGLYISGGNGTLIEGNLIDHNGWEDGWEVEGGQPPSMWSHNVYLQYNTKDVTFSDNVVMQGASFGAQLRGGAFAENNVFLDNNVAVSFLGGDYKDYGTIGNYTLFQDNVITSPSFKDGVSIGGKGWGLVNNGEMSVMLDNIIAHIAEPGNEAELAEKWSGGGHPQYLDKDPLYNDTIVYNWLTGKAISEGKDWSVNAEGLDTNVLDETTIQNFTAQLLGQDSATISDLSEYLRAQADGTFDDMIDGEDITAFFQAGFGVDTDIRDQTTTLTFIPNALGDGIRWDNKLNWSTQDLPGTIDGDSINLAGNWVHFHGTNVIEDFDFGSGGELRVSHGKITIEGETTAGKMGGTFNIEAAGQAWVNGYSDTDTLNINMDGGRFVNTGDLDGSVKMTVNDGDAILATGDASATFQDGSDLHIIGDAGDVGFDGVDGDTAVLRVGEGGSVTFEADAEGDFGTIQEVSTGAYGTDSDVQSGVNLQDGTLRIVLDGEMETGSEVLIAVDELVGTLDAIQIAGLASNQDAIFTVDYDTDQVSMNIVGGKGEAFYEEIGSADDAMDAAQLWAALTGGMGMFDDTPPEIELVDDVSEFADGL